MMKKINKEADKSAENTPKRKVLNYAILTFVATFLLVAVIMLNQGQFSITTYLGEKIPIPEENTSGTFTKIITEGKSSGNALFDISLNIPEKYKLIRPYEDVSVVVELVNFGDAEKTIVDVSYIVTSAKGQIVLIEHEERIVETQDSYLKIIDLPYLEKGDYKISVEILYSDKSAIAEGQFSVI